MPSDKPTSRAKVGNSAGSSLPTTRGHSPGKHRKNIEDVVHNTKKKELNNRAKAGYIRGQHWQEIECHECKEMKRIPLTVWKRVHRMHNSKYTCKPCRRKSRAECEEAMRAMNERRLQVKRESRKLLNKQRK